METKTYTNERGSITYRTLATAGDEISHTFVRMKVIGGGAGAGAAEVMARWALERFAITLTYKDAEGKEQAIEPFNMAEVDALPREVAAGGWIVDAALTIYREVWQKSEAEVDGVKKA